MRFFNKHDSDEYKRCLDSYIDYAKSVKHPERIKSYQYIEVCECGNIKCFRHPQSTHWWRFYGTWKDLHDKLTKDFPHVFPDVKFYTEAPIPGIIL